MGEVDIVQKVGCRPGCVGAAVDVRFFRMSPLQDGACDGLILWTEVDAGLGRMGPRGGGDCEAVWQCEFNNNS